MSRFENNRQVESLISTAHRTQSGWRAACPFCADAGHRDKKTSLQILGDGRWWCYRCSTKGKLREAPDPSALAQAVIRHMKDPTDPKAFEPPPYFVELGYDDSHALQPARDYLASRNVSLKTIKRLGIGACYDGRWYGRIIVPITPKVGDLRMWWGWVGRLWRAPNKDAQGLAALKYLYPSGMEREKIIYNGSVLSTHTGVPAMLVEGVFDTFPFPKRAFAVLGKVGLEQKKQIARVVQRPIAIVLDGDAWQEGHALSLSFQTNGISAGCVRLPPRKDPDEVSGPDLLDACRECLGKRDPVRL